MSSGHVVLIVVGSVALAESAMGICFPSKLKHLIGSVIEEAPDRSFGLAAIFAILSAIMWKLMGADQRYANWALLFLSWVFAGGSLINVKRNGLASLLQFMILRRSPRAIRLIYTGELALACVLLGFGIGSA